MSVAFDTLKFARTLRDRANMSPEQAEGVAEAFSEATSEQLATRADLHFEIAEARSELRAEIAGVKSELSAEIAGVKSEVLVLKGMSGFTIALIVAIFAKLYLH